jgi:DNA repair protein RecN (Recombination protein N)
VKPMLRDLNITNFAIIDKARIEFEHGLCLLTGETGAGKSIIIDALGMALGMRASADLVHSGAKEAKVEAVFSVGTLPELKLLADEAGFAFAGELILRRRLSAGGTSRAYINDSQVSAATLRQVGELLVTIHGQGEGDELLGPEGQLALLDAFAGNWEALEIVAALYDELAAVEAELAKINTDERERLRELDLLGHQIREIEAAKLDPHEEEELKKDAALLRNAERIRELADHAFVELYADDQAITGRLSGVLQDLTELAEFEPDFRASYEQLESLKYQIDDIAASLRDFMNSVENDPKRLELVENRLDVIKSLQRKYGATTDEVLSYLEKAESRYEELQNADQRSEALSRRASELKTQYDDGARSLRGRRRAAIPEFVQEVGKHLTDLAMGKARLEVELADNPRGRTKTGRDRVTFMISPNPGEEVKPLAKIASGGELSRLMLAIKSCAIESESGRTLIFDEVDAGIGGRVAEFVGRKLKRLSKGKQIICITHLPQVTVYADLHSKVVKKAAAKTTEVHVRRLNDADRIEELARMMGGEEITDLTREHAGDLLRQARDYTSRC